MSDGPNTYWRHGKTGRLYTLIGEAIMEADLTPVVLYQSVKDGQIWVRPRDNFYDGRFEMIEVED